MTAEEGVSMTPTTDATIEVTDVSRWYGNVVAVNNVSFGIAPGITGLLGPNGAGKSTLLHMMAGFLRPSSGEVRILGESSWRNEEMYRRVGVVQEREAVHEGLTGYEFVRLNARLHGLTDAHAATLRAINLVEMGEFSKRRTGGYSKGMKQRIKIAAAMVHEPEVLLLDEPFNGADPRQRLQMMDMLRAKAAEGCTVVFSSHILEEMERLGDQVLVIVAGRLAASGDFRAIRHLMTDRPHTFSITSSNNRGLARELIADEGITGVNVENGTITIHTRDFERVTHRIPVIARDADITITSMSPLDESLESVFEYLVQQ